MKTKRIKNSVRMKRSDISIYYVDLSSIWTLNNSNWKFFICLMLQYPQQYRWIRIGSWSMLTMYCQSFHVNNRCWEAGEKSLQVPNPGPQMKLSLLCNTDRQSGFWHSHAHPLQVGLLQLPCFLCSKIQKLLHSVHASPSRDGCLKQEFGVDLRLLAQVIWLSTYIMKCYIESTASPIEQSSMKYTMS